MSTTINMDDPRMKLAGVMIASQAKNGQADIEDAERLDKIPENVAKVGGIAQDRLRSLVSRIERLEGEKKVLGEDVKDIYKEAGSAGFDVKVLRKLIAIRKQDAGEVQEQEDLLFIYRRALGE